MWVVSIKVQIFHKMWRCWPQPLTFKKREREKKIENYKHFTKDQNLLMSQEMFPCKKYFSVSSNMLGSGTGQYSSFKATNPKFCIPIIKPLACWHVAYIVMSVVLCCVIVLYGSKCLDLMAQIYFHMSHCVNVKTTFSFPYLLMFFSSPIKKNKSNKSWLL